MAVKEALPNVPEGLRGGLQIGDEQYLWLLVVIEVVALFVLRQGFRRQHGG